MFGLATFISAILLIMVIVQQVHISMTPAIEQDESAINLSGFDSTEPSSKSGLSINRHAAFLLEELQAPTDPVQNRNAHTMPLDGESVKIAAYHLVKAEERKLEGHTSDALQHYENALRIVPGMADIHNRIGMIHMRNSNYEQAIIAFEQASPGEAMSFWVANNLGVAHLNLRQFDEAENNLLQAINLHPDSAPAHFNLARLYMQQGRTEDAAVSLSRFRELKTDDFGDFQNNAAFQQMLSELEGH